MKPFLTMPIERLRELFIYDEDAGILFWKISTNNRVRPGDIAGSTHPSGRRQVMCDGKLFKISRICYAMYHGEWPDVLVDHWDGDNSNDRPSNLRPATCRINCQNFAVHRAGKLCGASYHKRDRKWQASIWINGGREHLGYHKTEEAAHAAYAARLSELQS